MVLKVEGDPTDRPVVLLAEDDEVFRSLLSARLTNAGMHVIEVEDGHELRDYLQQTRDGGGVLKPDIVVSDVNMPRETGLQALERVQPLRMPVVLMTAICSAALRANAASAGVAAIFEKPFQVEKLVLTIRQMIGK